MYNFILQTAIFTSLAALIYLAAATLPRLTDKPEEAKPVRSLSGWLSFLPLEKMDNKLNALLERFLRRVKLVVMKLDNFLSRQLGKFKKD